MTRAPYRQAELPTVRIANLHELSHRPQIVGSRGVDGGPWRYTFMDDRDAMDAWNAGVNAGAILTHHHRVPGGAWLLTAWLARGASLGQVEAWRAHSGSWGQEAASGPVVAGAGVVV